MVVNSQCITSKGSKDDHAEKNNSNIDKSKKLFTNQNPISELSARFARMSLSTRETSRNRLNYNDTTVKSESDSLHELKLSMVNQAENLNEDVHISNNNDRVGGSETLPTETNSIEAIVAFFMVLVTLLKFFLRRRN